MVLNDLPSDESGAVVVPLTGLSDDVVPMDASSATSTHDSALRMFAAGEGLLISWQDADLRNSRRTWGPAVSATSSLAKGLNELTKAGGRASTAGKQLFTVELPPGQTIDNMVRAVGGGFRGLTRTAGSPKIVSHVRLQQVGGVGAATGAGLALGPLVGLVALSVATEMIAQRQMEKKLKAIQSKVDDIHRILIEQDQAVLSLAERQLKHVSAYLLDRVEIPTVAGTDTIFGDFARFLEVRLNRLNEWESIAEWAEARSVKDGKVDTPTLMSKLAFSDDDKIEKFGRNVVETYRALALQARIATLKRIEIAVRNPRADISNVEAAVNSELDFIANAQERLTNLLGTLAGLPLTVGFFSTPGTDRLTVDARARIGQFAHQLASSPSAVPVLTPNRRPTIELARATDGSFAVLLPEEMTI